MNALFRGSGVALVTPFRDGQVDYEAMGRLIDRQLEAGTDAVIVCGTTGEASTLTATEKDGVLSFALERVNGRVPVIAGTGSNCTAVSVRQSRRAQELGADGILAVTPYYNKASQAGLIAHYTAIADAVSIPVILYNVPSRTGVNLLPETAGVLSAHPNIRAIKEACGDAAQQADLARAADGRLCLYAGNDDQTLSILALGGAGVISAAANVAPGQMRGIVHSWFAGDAARSREMQLALLPLIRQLFADVNPIPVKAALAMLGLCGEEVRLPLTPLKDDKRQALRNVLQTASWT